MEDGRSGLVGSRGFEDEVGGRRILVAVVRDAGSTEESDARVVVGLERGNRGREAARLEGERREEADGAGAGDGCGSGFARVGAERGFHGLFDDAERFGQNCHRGERGRDRDEIGRTIHYEPGEVAVGAEDAAFGVSAGGAEVAAAGETAMAGGQAGAADGGHDEVAGLEATAGSDDFGKGLVAEDEAAFTCRGFSETEAGKFAIRGADADFKETQEKFARRGNGVGKINFGRGAAYEIETDSTHGVQAGLPAKMTSDRPLR